MDIEPPDIQFLRAAEGWVELGDDVEVEALPELHDAAHELAELIVVHAVTGSSVMVSTIPMMAASTGAALRPRASCAALPSIR